MIPLEKERDNAIGFIRLILASSVIYSHSFFLGGFTQEPLFRWTHAQVALGPLAVHAFFVLSGFLVTESYIRSRSLASYLWKRALRILPGLWVCLIVTAFVLTPFVWWLQAGPRPSLWSLFPDQVSYVVHNLFRPRTQIAVGNYPSGNIPWKGDWNGSLWTLFYEGACYFMVAAIGLLGLLKKLPRIGLFILLGFLSMHVLWRLLPECFPAITGRLFDTTGKEETLHFFAGMAWCLAPKAATDLLKRHWIAIACGVLWVLSWFSSATLWMSPLLLPPIIFALSDGLPWVGWERRLGGDYSYGIYIYGMPVQQCLASLGVHHLGWIVYFTASLGATALLARFSWWLIEGPALKLKSLRLFRPTATLSGIPS